MQKSVYVAFVDFTKAFDTVNRELLFFILRKLGWPGKFIRIIKKLYSNVRARLIVDGQLTKAFEFNSGVKQRCNLAPTLYGIYAAVLLWFAYNSIKHKYSIKNRFCHDETSLICKTKVLTMSMYIRETQYADDIAIFRDSVIYLFAASSHCLQHICQENGSTNQYFQNRNHKHWNTCRLLQWWNQTCRF